MSGTAVCHLEVSIFTQKLNLVTHYYWLYIGYTLGILTNAAVQSQASTAHPDPVHLNVQFLRPVSIKEIEVHVKTVRTGKQFTNLAIDLIQAVSFFVLSSLY